MACLLKPLTHHCASARWYVLLRAFQAPFRLLIATPRRPHLVDAQSKPPAKKMTTPEVSKMDHMQGGFIQGTVSRGQVKDMSVQTGKIE